VSGVRIPAPLLFYSFEKFLLIEKIVSFIKTYNLILPDDNIIAAVSGGVDSMVMLYCLNSIAREFYFQLSVVHINHGVRPIDSDKDEKLVQDWCKKHALKIHIRKLTGLNLESSEDDMRKARFAAFNELLVKFSDAKIALAHTLDDQLETFFMRLAKGSRLKGLCGIPVQRDAFIRPMLNLTKKEIYQYAQDNHISYNVDYTNEDTRKLRNQIRHQLVPKLTEIFGEKFYEGFQRSQQDLKAIYSAFMDSIQILTNKYVKKINNNLEIELKQYQKLSLPERYQLLNGCVSMFYPLNFQIRSTYFEQFDQFVKEASTGKQFQFNKNLICVKNRSSICFSIDQNVASEELELYPDHVVYIGRNKISLKKVGNSERIINKEKCTELICGDRINLPLKVRYWKRGDYFYPLGMNNKQKVSDFFINQKINRMEKTIIPLILNQSEIVWIAGMRLDDRYKLTKSCENIYKLDMDIIK
jgi:tRNA(Ile)-lysidine synthase